MRFRKEHKWHIFKTILDQIFKYFCMVTTVIVLVNGGMAWLSGAQWVLYSRDLMRIFLAAFFAVLPVLLYVFFDDVMHKGFPILRVIHFTLTAALVMGVLLLIEPTGRDFTLGTGVFAFLIYIAVYGYGYLRDRRVAAKLNKQLKELYLAANETCDGENATHRD
ncbi:MAG: hypothetical protein FWC92_02575 [Defluviitaleaceae bacterium]|nr:hypothetical protein [Defluviitaleaceae bacterium]